MPDEPGTLPDEPGTLPDEPGTLLFPRDGLARWSELHGGIDPHGTVLLARWLRVVQALAVPVARAGVPPDAVTATGVTVALAAPVLVRAPGGGPGAAAASAAVLVSSLLDGLDGAVAQLSDRVSSHGRTLDSACDRVAELAGFAALGLAGGARWWALGALAAAGLGVEGARVALDRHLSVTAWERPSRSILTAVGLSAVAARLPGAGAITTVVGLGLAGVGVAQFVWAVRRSGALDPSRSAVPGGAVGSSRRAGR